MDLTRNDCSGCGVGDVGKRASLQVAAYKASGGPLVPQPESRNAAAHSPPAHQKHHPSVGPASWMVCLGCSLAICAGIVNIVAFFFFGGFVSHVTGTTAQLAMHVEQVRTGMDSASQLLRAFLLVICFLFGAFLSGMLIEKSQVHFGGKSRYGLALLLNSALLFAAMTVTLVTDGIEHVPEPHDFQLFLPACLAAMACGLQNALCTMHFGAVVRTTHITGTVTDIGAVSGRIVMMLCRQHVGGTPTDHSEINAEVTRIRVLFPLFCGFIGGCLVGSLLCTAIGVLAVIVPASFTGLIGIVCLCFRRQLVRVLSKFEVSRLSAELHEVESALVRTRSRLQAASPTGDQRDDVSSVDLDEDISHMLEVVHDVEVSIEEINRERPRRTLIEV